MVKVVTHSKGVTEEQLKQVGGHIGGSRCACVCGACGLGEAGGSGRERLKQVVGRVVLAGQLPGWRLQPPPPLPPLPPACRVSRPLAPTWLQGSAGC